MALKDTSHPRFDDVLPQWRGDTASLLGVLNDAWGSASREEAILRWMMSRSPTQWALIDSAARTWCHASAGPPPGHDTTLARAWAACARDGRTRAAAVSALVADPHDAVPGFLIVRADDWVHPVRVAAEDALRRRAEAGQLPIEHWAPLLLARARRARARVFLARLIEAAPPAVDARLLTNTDRMSRRWALGRFLARRPDVDALRAALAPALDPAVTEPIAVRLAECADVAQLHALLVDRRAPVRAAAWGRLREQLTVVVPAALLVDGLLDRNPSVRHAARTAARARGVDPGAVYRAAPGLSAADRRRRLEGLEACRAPDVAMLAEGALRDEAPSVRTTAIAVLTRNHAGAAGILARRLADATHHELRAVVRSLVALRARPSPTQTETLWRGSPEQQWAAWRLERARGPWDRLVASLRASQAPDEALVDAAIADVRTWMQHHYTTAYNPPAHLRTAVDRWLAAAPLPEEHKALLRFAVQADAGHPSTQQGSPPRGDQPTSIATSPRERP